MPACWNEFEIIEAYWRLTGLLVGASIVNENNWLLDAWTGWIGTDVKTRMKATNASVAPAAHSLTAWRRKSFRGYELRGLFILISE